MPGTSPTAGTPAGGAPPTAPPTAPSTGADHAPPVPTGGGAAIAARLERLPWSRYQRGLFLIVATAWLFDSIDLGALTFLLSPISAEFGLTQAQAGLVGSAGFAGMFAGAVGAGKLADRFGRRVVFQYSIVLWGLASLALVFAWDLPSVLAFRFLLGVGMGAEFPVAAALVAEFLPADRRGRYAALLEGAWPVGFVLAGTLAYFLTPAIGWRGIFAVQAVLSVWALAIRRAVPESPRWLASRGRHAEAEAVLTGIEDGVRTTTGRPLPPVAPLKAGPVAAPTGSAASAASATSAESAASDASNSPGGIRELLAPAYRRRTVMLWIVWFCILLGYYGLTTWLGKLLTDNGFDIAESAGFILLMALWGIPGFLSAAYLIEVTGRKFCLAGYTLASAAAAFFYGQAGSHLQLIVAGSFLQFFFFGMWSSLYGYTPELFPTRSRGTGVGTATAAGRLGALAGPMLVPLLLHAAGTTAVFTASASLFAVAAVLVTAFLPETKKAVLEDISR